MSYLTNKNVLITGGASGIGRLIAVEAARRDARLILVDRDAAGLDSLRAELAAGGCAVSTHVCELADRDAIAATADRVLAACGRVDVLVNNAGIVAGKYLLDLSDAEIERTFAVNTLALYWTTRAFLPAMIESDAGHVVTVASAGGLVGSPRLTAYSASKFAAVGFDESLRMELRRQGLHIKTTVVCPFYIDTGMFEGVRTRFPWLLPILSPAYAARRIVRAIEHGRRRVLMPRVVHLIWLARLLPVSMFDRLMAFLGVTTAMDRFTGRE
jgi:all-trans-retinol dehydrogenase (NAD+)